VSRRYERGAIILTSNQSLGAWGEVFGDPVIATAILDRLLHHSITVNIRGDSYRPTEKMKAGLLKSKAVEQRGGRLSPDNRGAPYMIIDTGARGLRPESCGRQRTAGAGAPLRVFAGGRPPAPRQEPTRPHSGDPPPYSWWSPAPRARWEFLHVAVDDTTRLAYVEVLGAQDTVTCAAFLRRAVPWYGRCGIRIRRLLPITASPIARAFAQACRPWVIRQRFTRPYRPQTNGKAERLIQTLLREWAYPTPYVSSDQRTAALRPYLGFYNRRRPHASLGRRSPWLRFQEAA
jgi:transposase InsO family protein